MKNLFKFSVIVVIFGLFMSACSSSPESVVKKFKEDKELNEKDFKVMFSYMENIMNDTEFDNFTAREIRDKYPLYHDFQNINYHTRGEKYNEAFDEFVSYSIQKGKNAKYTFNPLYDLVGSKIASITPNQAELVTNYVFEALTSGLKGAELKEKFPYAETFMVNWSNWGDPVRKEAVDHAFDKVMRKKIY